MRNTQRAKIIDARTRILVVDEESLHLRALCNKLKEQGYVTKEFGNTNAALAALRGGRFDVLLTVLSKPDIDGVGLMRAAQEINPQLTGIVMTGEGTVTSVIEKIRLGSVRPRPKSCGTSAIEPILRDVITVDQKRKP